VCASKMKRIRNTLLPNEITLLLMPARGPPKGVTQKNTLPKPPLAA